MLRQKSSRLAILVPLLFLCLQMEAVIAGSGMGCSDYEAKVTFKVGESKRVEVAKLFNTGTVNLNVSATYLYNSGGGAVEIVCQPAWMILNAGDSTSWYINAKAVEAGNCSGFIEFVGDVTPAPTGNPISTSSMARVSFIVTEAIEPEQSSDEETQQSVFANPLLLYGGLTVFAVCVGLILYLKRGFFIHRKVAQSTVPLKTVESKRDRRQYMKEYMRKRRKQAKEAKGKEEE